nr:MAG TPA: NAF-1 BOUND, THIAZOLIDINEDIONE, OXIDATIVE STRESS [Bacteriophage sp.]
MGGITEYRTYFLQHHPCRRVSVCTGWCWCLRSKEQPYE